MLTKLNTTNSFGLVTFDNIWQEIQWANCYKPMLHMPRLPEHQIKPVRLFIHTEHSSVEKTDRLHVYMYGCTGQL